MSAITAKQSAFRMVDSADVVLMPKELTAENGAKALLIGEFHVETQVPNPDYDPSLDDEDEEPEFFTAQIAVPWDTIKKIYAKAAGHFAKPAHTTDLLKACKDVLAALEKATQETGEILWLDHALPGVHESAMERLQNVIDDAEGRAVEEEED